MKILLVDDDPDTRSIYGELLTEAGYEVSFASNGEEGLKKILDGGYNLILLDIMMPKIDGMQILKKLQETSPREFNGPVVVLSALDQDHIIREALNLGAKGYLPKPRLSPDEVLAKIAKFIQDDVNIPL